MCDGGVKIMSDSEIMCGNITCKNVQMLRSHRMCSKNVEAVCKCFGLLLNGNNWWSIRARHKKFGVDVGHRYTYTLHTKHCK